MQTIAFLKVLSTIAEARPVSTALWGKESKCPAPNGGSDPTAKKPPRKPPAKKVSEVWLIVNPPEFFIKFETVAIHVLEILGITDSIRHTLFSKHIKSSKLICIFEFKQLHILRHGNSPQQGDTPYPNHVCTKCLDAKPLQNFSCRRTPSLNNALWNSKTVLLPD